MSNMTQTETITLQCSLNARLGALDRVLGVLSHQGVLPLQMHAVMTTNTPAKPTDGSLPLIQLTVVLPPCEPEVLAKRVKLIEKQIDVICCEVK
ncbi:MAG: hypothetical protein VKK59_00440 [Vampirovibrionales bacterium]|nr:hypothetical protein [Vampirovibrionales bacterium]